MSSNNFLQVNEIVHGIETRSTNIKQGSRKIDSKETAISTIAFDGTKHDYSIKEVTKTLDSYTDPFRQNNEIEALTILKDNPHAPKLLNSNGKTIKIEYIDGIKGNSINWNELTYKEVIGKIVLVFDALISIKSAGIILTDPFPRNFIFVKQQDGSDSCVFVDLEDWEYAPNTTEERTASIRIMQYFYNQMIKNKNISDEDSNILNSIFNYGSKGREYLRFLPGDKNSIKEIDDQYSFEGARKMLLAKL